MVLQQLECYTRQSILLIQGNISWHMPFVGCAFATFSLLWRGFCCFVASVFAVYLFNTTHITILSRCEYTYTQRIIPTTDHQTVTTMTSTIDKLHKSIKNIYFSLLIQFLIRFSFSPHQLAFTPGAATGNVFPFLISS